MNAQGNMAAYILPLLPLWEKAGMRGSDKLAQHVMAPAPRGQALSLPLTPTLSHKGRGGHLER